MMGQLQEWQREDLYSQFHIEEVGSEEQLTFRQEGWGIKKTALTTMVLGALVYAIYEHSALVSVIASLANSVWTTMPTLIGHATSAGALLKAFVIVNPTVTILGAIVIGGGTLIVLMRLRAQSAAKEREIGLGLKVEYFCKDLQDSFDAQGNWKDEDQDKLLWIAETKKIQAEIQGIEEDYAKLGLASADKYGWLKAGKELVNWAAGMENPALYDQRSKWPYPQEKMSRSPCPDYQELLGQSQVQVKEASMIEMAVLKREDS